MIRKNIAYSALCSLAVLLLLSDAARALEAISDSAAPVTEEAILGFVNDHLVQSELVPPGAKVQIDVGSPSQRLAACAHADLFLPPAMQLWGQARVGLRCMQGARWTVYIPVVVTVIGPALVLHRPVAAGHAVTDDDFRTEEIELTRELPGLLGDPAALGRRVAARYLPSGTLLRADHLRAKPVVVQGDPVRVVFLGSGFTVESEGTATTSATEGESVRVQVDSGRVISGTAHEGRRVEIQ